MADALKEAIRLVIETEGREGVDAMRKALAGIGDVSAETVADTDRLLDSLVGLNDAAAKAARFQQLTDELEKTTQALDHASREAIQFSLQLAETEKPSKKMQAEYRGLREEVARLEGVQKKQAVAQEAVGRELREAGIDATKFSTAERALRANVEGVTTALQKQVGVIDAEAAATRKQKQATADADDAFRKFAQSGTASADALKRYRAGADGAAAGTRNLADQGGRLNGMFTGLRSLIAPVLAYLSFDAARQGIANLIGVGAAAENARRSLQNLYGGVEEGNRAYEGLRNMAKQSGLAFADLVEDAKKLKAFGLDPLNGSLQALIDQNAAVGGSQQDLSGKVLALGQAWAKQKLQGEEILQLVERGVPVWSLLEQATGKNVQELQKLSEQGKLGRDVIKQLYEEIGRANTGAAERGLSSLTGLLAQASARWQEFQQKIADSGVTEYFKKQIQALLASTGNMDALAKKVADGIIAVLDAVKTGVVFIANHITAIKELAAAYAAFKVLNAVSQLNQFRIALLATAEAQAATTAAMAASQAGAAGLATRLKALPGAVHIAVALVGIELAIRYGKDLGEVLAKNSELVKGFEQAEEQSRLSLYETARGYRDKAAALGQYASTTVLAASKVAALSETERKAYEASLEGQRKRLEALNGFYRAMEAADALTSEMEASWSGVKEQLAAVTEGLKQSAAAAEATASAHKKAADEQIKAVAEAKLQYEGLRDAGMNTAEAIQGAFQGIKFTTPEGVLQAAALLEQIALRSSDASDAVNRELSSALRKVAVEDLPLVKRQAEDAMAAGKAGAVDFAKAVDQAIKVAEFTKLGVDIDAIRTGFTEAGRSAVDAFKGAVKQVDDLGLTVEQKSKAIAQAFDNAFKQASTKAELAALKAALQDALSSGDIGFAEFQARVAQVDAKLAELSNTGKKVGDGVKEGADKGASALSGLSSAASGAASSLDKAAAATAKANEKSKQGQGTLASFALAWDGMNDAALRAMTSMNKYLVNGLTATHSLQYRRGIERLTAEMQRQLKTVRDLVAAAEEQNAVYDENEQRLRALRQQYGYLADNELQRLIDAENKLKENRQRADEEAARKAEETAAAYRAQREEAEAAAQAAAESGSALTQRSDQSALTTAAAATQVLDSAADAANSIRQAASSVSSAELTLRVIAEPNQGTTIVLTQQQINDISAAVIRAINLAKGSST